MRRSAILKFKTASESPRGLVKIFLGAPLLEFLIPEV